MKYIYSLLLCAVALLSHAQSRGVVEIPPYFEDELKDKLSSVKKELRKSTDCFFFWTDSHLQSNDGYAADIITAAADSWNIRTPKAFFGGDAIPAFAEDITPYLQKYRQQCATVMSFGRLYLARGNHDFTHKYAPGGEGVTYDNHYTSTFIEENMTRNGVVRNPEDTATCYYYFDEPAAKLRYVVMDSSDSLKSTTVGFGLVNTISELQRHWIFSEAILKAPENYSIVIISHIPQFDFAPGNSTPEVVQALGAFANHRRHEMDGREYAFDRRKDLKLIAVFSGHVHHDMQVYKDGVLHVMMMGDVRYRDFRRDPYLSPEVNRKTGTVNAHAIDLVCYSKKSETLRLFRIGAGPDRVFHLKPINLSVGDVTSLPDIGNIKRCGIYDSDADLVPDPSEKYAYKWELKQNVAEVVDGKIHALSAGEATLMIEQPDGQRSFYSIRVENR